jgi:hypothetical protein
MRPQGATARTHLMEGIGIALDMPGNRMFVTDFAGSVYSADLDGKKSATSSPARGISPAQLMQKLAPKEENHVSIRTV